MNSCVSFSSKSLGTLIALPQTKLHFEKGSVIKKESQDFKVKFLEDQNPNGIIGILVCLEILIIPSETFSFGPRGPSGVIAIEFLFFKSSKIGRIFIFLFLSEIVNVLEPKKFAIVAPNCPSV